MIGDSPIIATQVIHVARDLFQAMMERIQDRVVKYLWRMEVVVEHEQQQQAPRAQRMPPPKPKQQPMFFSSGSQEPQTVKRKEAKVGRNDPCPCGSGKKYKKCHGTAA